MPEAAEVVSPDENWSRTALLERPADEWIETLSGEGPVKDRAVADLRDLMVRAARHQVSRMVDAHDLGAARREEAIHAAANEATMSVLARLDSFEGRSRFSTWAFKFGILHANTEVRRVRWRDREIELHDSFDPPTLDASSPEAVSEATELGNAVRNAVNTELTGHQRKVALALLVDDVPIDVLAERLGTNRNAIYKTLHDVRQRLRRHLAGQGFLAGANTREVSE